jgi:NADH pyrophosphatase NudC (nudix superfamily)
MSQDARLSRGRPVRICARCGAPMEERQCKVVCRNCGAYDDCSDP